ncbi:NAD(P)-binding protein [Caulobacter sp. 17J80-11]|nr:NAD(P)-binding protein [Caulobacter sp. 17J80-11]
MSRFARNRPVYVVEEPRPADPDRGPSLDMASGAPGVSVATPRLPAGLDGWGRDVILRQLLDELLDQHVPADPVFWYCTPTMLPFSRHRDPAAVIYDCAHPVAASRLGEDELRELESELLGRADLVFAGGWSLFEAKKARRRDVHPFPPAVDRAHFATARGGLPEPADQQAIPGPRLGWFGAIDRRLDLGLLAAVADARPAWNIVLVGPVIGLADEELPRRPNLHYLGAKPYADLPAYLAGWDVGLIPFARGAAARFACPPQTAEYLAGGRPVVATPLVDLVRHWGELEAVRVAATPEKFVQACQTALDMSAEPDGGAWRAPADTALAESCWDLTHARMAELVEGVVSARRPVSAPFLREIVSAPAVRPSARRSHYDVLVVGAGMAGAVAAERLAAEGGKRVLLIDRRPHLGGTAYDHLDAAGIRVGKYGAHVLHTDRSDVFHHLSRFTDWRPCAPRVLTSTDGKLVPSPINRTALNALFGLDLAGEQEAAAFLAARTTPAHAPRTAEAAALARLGPELYESVFRGWARKRWGVDPSALHRRAAARAEVRLGDDDRYFTDTFQAVPAKGFGLMFENLLDHDGIHLELDVEFEDVRREVVYDHLVFTGPLDGYFEHRFGELPFRSVRFRHETLDQEWHQPAAVVEFPSEDTAWSRIVEHKHLTGQVHPKTSITYEQPGGAGDPFYPVPTPENLALHRRYAALARAQRDATFIGRLASYRELSLGEAAAQALAASRRLIRRGLRHPAEEDQLTAAALAI